MIEITVTLTFNTPPNIGSGAQEGSLADRAFIKARDGWPYIPATALKGRLRHAVEQIARSQGLFVCAAHRKMCRDLAQACPVCRIFGSPWIPGRLCFVDLDLSGPKELLQQRSTSSNYPRYLVRHGIGINRRRGVVEDALLYTTELFYPGVPVVFSGILRGEIDIKSAAWVVAGFRFMTALGQGKSAGLGWLDAEVVVMDDGEALDLVDLRAALQEGL